MKEAAKISKMATTIDKHYATEGEKKPLTSNEERPPFTEYERISNAKPSVSEEQPFTDSVMLRNPRTVKLSLALSPGERGWASSLVDWVGPIAHIPRSHHDLNSLCN